MVYEGYIEALTQPLADNEIRTYTCQCSGPKNGEPHCPCIMKAALPPDHMAQLCKGVQLRPKPRHRVQAGSQRWV